MKDLKLEKGGFPIFIIGYMGSDRIGAGKAIAHQLGRPLVSLDEEIEKQDGRTILRMCMTMGEHEYRNKEYEMLAKFLAGEFPAGMDSFPVVICSDGIVLDDMNLAALKELYEKNSAAVVLVDEPLDIMWERAKEDKGIPYAFMHVGTPALRYEKFCTLYETRKPLYNQFKSEFQADE